MISKSLGQAEQIALEATVNEPATLQTVSYPFQSIRSPFPLLSYDYHRKSMGQPLLLLQLLKDSTSDTRFLRSVILSKPKGKHNKENSVYSL